MTDLAGTLFGWFQRAVRRYGDAVALEVDGTGYRYAELSVLAERLAALMVATAGGVPRRAGLLATRSLAGYAGYLAALRLGATVVPLSPTVPAARNRDICRAAAVDLIVTDDAGGAGVDRLPGAGTTTPVLRLAVADPWYAGTRLPPPWPAVDPSTPDDVAYVAFTSGSTGRPKGVPVRHRNAVSCLALALGRRAVGPGDRFAQTFDLTFDLWTYSTFVAWGSGATLVDATAEDVLTPARFVTRHRITHWHSVPSVITLAGRLRGLAPGAMPTLRQSMFCGEQLTLDQARAWAAAAPGSTVWNLYGPTELAMVCAEYRLPADPAGWPRSANGTVPIGTVHPHLESVVLTEDGTAGSTGELCVRGPQRFDGYLDPAENAGRFVAVDSGRTTRYDGTLPLDGRHWYRTGDRVRVEATGQLVHLGRVDHQVKVLGHRVELGEIETVLKGLPGAGEVVVLALPGQDGGVDLHACYTGAGVSADELDAGAVRRLPDHMRPRAYHRLDALPRNLNGKVDRNELAARVTEHSTVDDYVTVIWRMWCDVLRTDEVPLDANFFDVGGDSRALVVLFERLAALAPRPLVAADLFTHSTVLAQARLLSGGAS